MLKPILKTLVLAIAITVGSAALAVITNAIRPSGIPLITDVPYDIYAPCKDSNIKADAASDADLASTADANELYIDARPADLIDTEHVKGAINVPYSALFGATEEDVAKVKKEALAKTAKTIIVYGVHLEGGSEDKKVDFGKPLAQQLIESDIKGVKHVAGGLDKMKTSGIETVQKGGAVK